MQGTYTAMEMPPPSLPTSPPASPGMQYAHQKRPSTASMAMQRSKRSSSRITDGVTSRSSDEDSRTAVKVAVRVRPPLQPSDPGYDLIPQRFRESTCDVSTPTSLSVQSPQGKKLFVFDRVFNEETTQDGIWQYLSDSVSSFVKGYNVSILAYGQSGSGKSYTMGTSGPDDQSDPNIMGIVPRAAQALFDKLGGTSQQQKSGIQTPKRYSTQGLPNLASKIALAGADKNWSLKATYVEIYQEQLRDLLVSDSVPVQDRAAVAIREDTKGRILVTGLTQININSVEDLLNALNFGSAIRQTDATNINARSSRSHAVFSLNLVQKKTDGTTTSRQEKRMSTPVESVSGAENVVTLDSKLHFVDLAGSERLKNTGATGDRAKEGISINAGLASLGKVISQLSSKHANAHISYRDSRLTRLLQDSLGGNAITFMVACVTPAVFHLSETLNTVHYAQRARAIQSKPEIQQSREEGDKQAAIDRLRAEVSFLRDQIRHSEHADPKAIETRGRSERLRGREGELQTQLMDMQENYTALSNRHAKLISELSKAQNSESADTPFLTAAIGESATERVKRSNSFAEAVEQMVLEYEKTIQALEGSLSNTRSSLSNSESTLLEKETRIAYMETIQQQLQARIQKAMDREQSNESYLRDLENRMEGTFTSEEKSATIVDELRKELTRVRESESSAEDYISTLEERLAEAEQDQEIMQSEIDRLEHVVERQRSIGRLDNLLGELDIIRQNDGQGRDMAAHTNGDVALTNGYTNGYDPFAEQSRSASAASAAVTRDEDFEDAGSDYAESHGIEDEPTQPVTPTRDLPRSSSLGVVQSTPQDEFMADKVENLTQELFDLRSEHENVMTDYDKLQQKYQTALETLAKLEYDKETRKLTDAKDADTKSFLADAGMRGEEKAAGGEDEPSSSRSLLSAELPSQSPSKSSFEELNEKVSAEEPVLVNGMSSQDEVDPAEVPLPADPEVHPEVEMLRRLNAENEVNFAELTNSYKSLHATHEDTLAQVEDLKQEIAKAQNMRPASPSYNKTMFKRKSEDLLGIHADKATRSITSLRTLAHEHFEEDPDKGQSFQLNLNTLMSELSSRSERVQSLESELVTAKREMDNKQTIINGLTRERSSLKASLGVDFSVVSQMREQLLDGETRIRALQEEHSTKEKELQDQIESLKTSLAAQPASLPTPSEDTSLNMPGGFAVTPMEGSPADEPREFPTEAGAAQPSQEQSAIITRLQNELAEWETKHQDAMDFMRGSEAQLLATIAKMEESMRSADVKPLPPLPVDAPAADPDAVATLEEERAKHKDIVDALSRQVEEYKSTANDHVTKLEQLEEAYSRILQQSEEDAKSRDLNSQELKTHKDLVANLENQLQVHKSAVTIHQDSLETLQSSHSKELEDLRMSMASTEKSSAERFSTLQAEHDSVTDGLRSQLSSAQSERDDVIRSASSALGYWTDPSKLHSQIKGLVDEGKELHGRHLKTTNELKSVQEELQRAMTRNVEFENKMNELKAINDETLTSLEKANDREKKNARLIEEMEEQLNNNYDSHQATNHRLSAMQGEVAQKRIELERELETQKMKNQALEQQIEVFNRQSVQSSASGNRESLAVDTGLGRNGSGSSQARKPAGPTTLPTPPPSIPLPPLPNSPVSATPQIPNGIDGRTNSPPLQRNTSPVPNHSPPGSRHPSNDIAPGVSQQLEEQETRIRTIEKHLFAEKQLTATLEEALVDLETSANRTKAEMESWRKKCTALEDELEGLRKDRTNSRASLQAVEEEREMRVRAEKARQALEERMRELNAGKKKKKSGLNCF